jgi:hypothetical protein
MATCLVRTFQLLLRFFNWALKTLLRPFIEFTLALLRATVIVGAIVAILITTGGFGDDLQASFVLIITWSLAFAIVLGYREDHTAGIVNEMLIVILILCKTLMALDQTIELTQSRLDSMWLWSIPMYALIIYTGLGHVQFTWVEDRELPEATIQYSTVHAVSITTLIVSSLIIPVAIGIDDTFTLTSVSGVVTIVEAGVVAVMMSMLIRYQEHETDNVWQGGSLMLLQWMLLQIATLPLVTTSAALFLIKVIVLIAVVVLCLLMTRDLDAVPVINRFWVCLPVTGAWELFRTALDMIKLVAWNPRTYQISILFAVTVLLGTMDKQWFYTHVHFPKGIRKICDAALWLIDNIIAVFYKYTNQPDVQKILMIAGHAIGQIRANIYRTLTPVYKWLVVGQVGLEHTYIPTQHTFSLLAFLVGPFITAAGVMVQVFEDGAVFARSKWFWAVAFFGNLIFFFATSVLPGTNVTLVHAVFIKSEYSRVYSDNGNIAYVATIAILVSCLALFAITTVTDSVDTVLMRELIDRFRRREAELKQDAVDQKRQLALVQDFTARFAEEEQTIRDAIAAGATSNGQQLLQNLGTRRDAAFQAILQPRSNIASRARLEAEKAKQSMKKPEQTVPERLYEMATSPALLVALFGVFWITTVFLRSGSPFKSIAFKPIPTGNPDWLISTDFDKVAIFANKLIEILLKAMGLPDFRMITMMMLLIVKELGCVACVCLELDFFDDIKGAFESFGDIFSRRRLLEYHGGDDMDERDYSYAQTYANSTSSAFGGTRRLLEYSYSPDQSCSKSSSCSGYYFCLADVLKPIVPIVTLFIELLSKGLDYVVDFFANLVMDLLPQLKVLNDLFGRIKEMVDFGDFDLLDGIDLSFDFEMFGLEWGMFPNINNPMPSLSHLIPSMGSFMVLIVVCILIVVVMVRLGILQEVITTAITAAVLSGILTAVALAIALSILVIWLKDEVRVYHYEVVIEFYSNIYFYAIGFGLLVFAAFLVIGAATATHLSTLQSELTSVRKADTQTTKEKKTKKKTKKSATGGSYEGVP